VSTFTRWLTDQSGRGKQDPIGWLARVWGSLEPEQRARISSPTSVKKVLAAQGSQTAEWQDYMASAVDTAIEAYRERDTAQQLGPAVIEPVSPETAGDGTVQAPAAELAGEGTMAAEPALQPKSWEGWATEPEQRLGTCLTCGALMGVGMIRGQKVLMCMKGHPVSKRVARQLVELAYDAAIEREDEHLPAPSDPEPQVTGPHPADSELTIFDRLLEIESNLAELASDQGQELAWVRDALIGHETMLGLLAQMLAAASPAAAGVLAQFVQGEGPPGDDGAGPPQPLPAQEMPASFQAYYGMAPGRPGEPDG
jgi:hypothetical protein